MMGCGSSKLGPRREFPDAAGMAKSELPAADFGSEEPPQNDDLAVSLNRQALTLREARRVSRRDGTGWIVD
jgi:hypothetical protein